MHERNDTSFDPIFLDPEFRSKFDSLEKRTQFYWNTSSDLRSDGLRQQIGDVLKGTCHIISTSTEQNKLIYKKVNELEDLIVRHGKKINTNLRGNNSNLISLEKRRNA